MKPALRTCLLLHLTTALDIRVVDGRRLHGISVGLHHSSVDQMVEMHRLKAALQLQLLLVLQHERFADRSLCPFEGLTVVFRDAGELRVGREIQTHV